MIPGPQVKLGETTFVVPPLPWTALKQYKAFLSRAMRGDIDPSAMYDGEMDNMFGCVYAALKRNYPDLTEDKLGELVDMRNISDVFAAVMQAAGFREGGAGEVRPAGPSKT